MFSVRDLLQDVLFLGFKTVLRWASTAKRRWRQIVAATTMAVAALRVVIWLAKAIASAGTVDTAANLIGLGEYVRPFEEAVDGMANVVIDAVIAAVRAP